MGWRSWNIAVEHHAEYAAQGNRQQLRTYTLAASRGNVVDRNHISMAVNDRLERIDPVHTGAEGFQAAVVGSSENLAGNSKHVKQYQTVCKDVRGRS